MWKRRTEWLGTFGGALRGFRRDEGGATIIVFALGFATVMMAAAVALDYGRAESERAKMQRALDSAALAAAHQLGLPDQDQKGRAVAEAYFRANLPGGSTHAIDELTLNSGTGVVQMGSGGSIMSTMLSAFGISRIDLGAGSRVVRGDGTAEVALVLDNSGSMAGQSIIDLRAAARDLIGVLYAGATTQDKVQVAVVPFAGSVNVGPGRRDDGWIDVDGAAPVHFESFAEPRTRFDIFAQMGATWAGCVEARSAPHDVTDTAPGSGGAATLFVPMFAPDEPDSGNAGGASYPNNYLSDFGGSCPTPPQVCTNYNSRKQRCEAWGPAPLSQAVAQARTCKYDGASPTISSSRGPNYGCTTTPLLPLTSDKTAAETAVDAMLANGSTNIGEGLMWGWRTLSPEPPFAEGRSWSDTRNQKIIVLMTDGQNTYQRYSGSHNWTWYGAFGHAAKGRLGTTNTATALLTAMNAKTAAACANAKAKGITVYTIAFRLESDPSTLSLLANCASGSSKAFTASDGSALIQTFQIIGREISQLRVAG